jgi:uncharacterized protein YegL
MSLQSLFNNANGMSQQSVDLMIQNLDAQTGLGCVGAQIDDLNTDDVTLLTIVLDESGSMDSLRDTVIDAFNTMTRALHDSKARDSILVSCWTFHSAPKLLYSHTPIDRIKDLTRAQYAPNGGTAMYDAVLDAFTGIVAYGQELRNAGIRARSLVVVISDGDDNTSGHTPAAVKTVAADLLKQETYTLAFVGFGDPKQFNAIAASMGFNAVLTTNNSASEIRRVLNVVSNSVIRTSQTKIQPTGNSFFTP